MNGSKHFKNKGGAFNGWKGEECLWKSEICGPTVLLGGPGSRKAQPV